VLARSVSLCTALAVVPAAYAVDWRLEPSLSASAIYTDNANQSARDSSDAHIFQVMPGFTLQSEGSRRLQAVLQYWMTAVSRLHPEDVEDTSTDFLHRLNAATNAELIDDFLFFDGTARISQELISFEGPLAPAEINDSNRAAVGTYSLSPHIKQRLGNFAKAQARYSASGAIFENNVAADATVNTLTAGLESGTYFRDVRWGLDYSLREARNEDISDATFERAVASFGYVLTRTFRLLGTVGEEWNDYPSVSETDGSSWSAGFGWSPSRRTRIEASAGERFFGDTYNLSASHRTRVSTWHLGYAEDLSDLTQSMLNAGLNDYVCVTSSGTVMNYPNQPYSPNLMDPELLGCTAADGTPSDLRNGVFISKAARAGMTWGAGRLRYSLNAFDVRRDFQLADAEDRTRGVTAGVIHTTGPHTRVSSTLGYTNNIIPAVLSVSNTDRDDDIYLFTLGISHQLDPTVLGGVTYQRQQRESNLASADFTENRVTATVSMTF
jgi:uncharacterized protein (PEP-CTERM system associated)